MTIAKDIKRNQAFAKLSDEEQERRAKGESEGNAEVNYDLPSHRTDFVLVYNEAAIRLVPEDFAHLCLTDTY